GSGCGRGPLHCRSCSPPLPARTVSCLRNPPTVGRDTILRNATVRSRYHTYAAATLGWQQNKNRFPRRSSQCLEMRRGHCRRIMITALSEVDTLVRKLDLDFGLDEVRREAAQLMRQELEARRDPLASWEKMHCEMANALLPMFWL